MSNRFVNPDPQFFDNSGQPLNGGKLRSYITATSTPTPTYSNSTLGVSNGTVITLDSAGRSTVDIFLDPAIVYKFTLETSAAVILWTRDPVVDLAANIYASVQVYAGNPNGHVAGNAGTPGSTGAGMVYDITNGILYICTTTGNAAAAVWTSLSGGLSGGEDIYTTDQTIAAANVGRIATANKATAITFNLTASATIGAGKLFGFKNIGAGVLTVDPNGAELIEGISSLQLTTNEGALVYCTGGTWRVLANYRTLEVAEATVADSATPLIGAAASVHTVAVGTTTVTGFDNVQSGIVRHVRWASARTLTYNVTSLILIGAQTRGVSANDISTFRSEGGGNWRETNFSRASTYPLISPPGFRNIARRNGGLEIWQRGAGGAASFAVAASAGSPYTADGWYLSNGANQASIVSQQVGLTNGSQWSARVIRNSGQTGTGGMLFGFPLDTDELYPLLGQFVRLSYTLKAGANWSPTSGRVDALVVCGTGTPAKAAGFAGSTTALQIANFITTSATRYQGSGAAIIPTTTRQLEIYFAWTPVGTAGGDDSIYIDDVQLEIVPDVSQQASPFEYLNFHEALQLCKRHYQKTFEYDVAPATSAGLVGAIAAYGVSTTQPTVITWYLPVEMRISGGATVTGYNPSAANAQIRNNTDGADFSGTTMGLSAYKYVTATGTVNGGMGAGDLLYIHATADTGI